MSVRKYFLYFSFISFEAVLYRSSLEAVFLKSTILSKLSENTVDFHYVEQISVGHTFIVGKLVFIFEESHVQKRIVQILHQKMKWYIVENQVSVCFAWRTTGDNVAKKIDDNHCGHINKLESKVKFTEKTFWFRPLTELLSFG